MKHSVGITSNPLAAIGTLVCLCLAMSFAEEEPSTTAVSKRWTRDISQFETELLGVVKEAKVPDLKSLVKRLEEEPRHGSLEVITDGGGGVVDFKAAMGTVQYEVNEKFAGMFIQWEFELAQDTEIFWDDSTILIPKLAGAAKVDGESIGHPFFGVHIEESDAGPFQAGDRVSLKASIDDFSRFRKNYGRAKGVVAVYYLEEEPNPTFVLRLDEAKVTLLKSNAREQDRADQPATAVESKGE